MEKKYSPNKICLIHGNQQLLIQETCNKIIDQILDGRERELCIERFNAQEIIKVSKLSENITIEDFFISVSTVPMLSDLKIIIVDNFDLIKKTNKKNENFEIHSLYESIKNLIQNPPDFLWFIFVSKVTRENDFNKAIYQVIKKNWSIKKFVAYDNSAPNKWFLERAQEKGLPMSNDIAQIFIDIVGSDLSNLENELEKLSLFFLDENFSEDHIKKNLRGHKNFTIFRMTESLSNKELKPALEILDDQLKKSPHEQVRLFAVIVMQFRRLICIKSMYKKFHNEKEILQKISLPTFLGKQLLSQSKNFKDEELHNIFIELANLDLRIKFDSNITPLLLQEFFQSICSGKFKKKFFKYY